MTAPVSVDVSEGFGALPPLRAAWDGLFLSRPNEPSTSFEWTTAMASHHVKEDDRCFLLRLHRGGTLVGIVPLIRRVMKVMGQRVGLLLPLSEQYNTHSDLLLASPDDECVSALVSALFRLDVRWDCFRIARLLEENPLVPALRRALSAGGHVHGVREGLPAYVLDLPSSFDQYLACRSAKCRNHLKRITRKLHEAGDVQERRLEHGDGFDAAFGTMGGAVAAAELAVEKYGRHWGLKLAYDEQFSHYSPALLLVHASIQAATEHGLTAFEFLGSAESWQERWKPERCHYVLAAVYPFTRRSMITAVRDAASRFPMRVHTPHAIEDSTA